MLIFTGQCDFHEKVTKLLHMSLLTSPLDISLHANLNGGQNFPFPTLFDSYRELLLNVKKIIAVIDATFAVAK